MVSIKSFNIDSLKNHVFTVEKILIVSKPSSSRYDTDWMHDLKLIWASGESETKGKGGKKSWSNLML